MPRLNYRHLRVLLARGEEGGVTAASKILQVGQPAISAQIRKLERALGEDSYDRSRRTMELTEVGQVVYSHADEIFAIGRDFTDGCPSPCPN